MKEKFGNVRTYNLSGDGLKIVFSIGDSDELELVYEDEKMERRFSGEKICLEETKLGFVASVVLDVVYDLHTIILSLAVPAANRPDNVKSISVKTFAVRTTDRTSFAGPGILEGQIRIYETSVLEGTAW